MLVPVSRTVNLASVEELMQEIHKFDTGTSLKQILYLVLISIKGVFTFFC